MRYLVLIFLISLLAGCSQTIGEVSVMKYMPPKQISATGKAHAGVQTPLVNAVTLSDESRKGLIFRNRNPNQKRDDEIFSIYLTDAYIKYMQDLWGLNELLFIFEFTEVVDGAETDTVTKILGPYEGVADATFAPIKNKLIYGPKLMQSDVVSMKLTVLEFDGKENEESTSILDFIQGATQTFKLANPVTSSQLQLTAELSKTLLQANEDEVVMTIDIDFVAGNTRYDKIDNGAQVIALEAGQMLFVKREACRLLVCFDYLRTKNDSSENFLGALGDILYSPAVAFNRTFFDTPDSDSLTPFDFEKFNSRLGGREVIDDVQPPLARKKPNQRVSTIAEPLRLDAYREKSWLLFNIVKGGSDDLWEKRKILKDAEKKIKDLVERSTDLSDADPLVLDKAFGDVIKAVKEEKLFKQMGGVIITPDELIDGRYAIAYSTEKSEFCLREDKNLPYEDIVVLPKKYSLDKFSASVDNSNKALKGANVDMSVPALPENLECFDLTGVDSQVKDELLSLVVIYKTGEFDTRSVSIPLIINPTIKEEVNGDSDSDSGDGATVGAGQS